MFFFTISSLSSHDRRSNEHPQKISSCIVSSQKLDGMECFGVKFGKSDTEGWHPQDISISSGRPADRYQPLLYPKSKKKISTKNRGPPKFRKRCPNPPPIAGRNPAGAIFWVLPATSRNFSKTYIQSQKKNFRRKIGVRQNFKKGAPTHPRSLGGILR